MGRRGARGALEVTVLKYDLRSKVVAQVYDRGKLRNKGEDKNYVGFVGEVGIDPKSGSVS